MGGVSPKHSLSRTWCGLALARGDRAVPVVTTCNGVGALRFGRGEQELHLADAESGPEGQGVVLAAVFEFHGEAGAVPAGVAPAGFGVVPAFAGSRAFEDELGADVVGQVKGLDGFS